MALAQTTPSISKSMWSMSLSSSAQPSTVSDPLAAAPLVGRSMLPNGDWLIVLSTLTLIGPKTVAPPPASVTLSRKSCGPLG